MQLLAASQDLETSVAKKNNAHLGHRTQMIQAGPDLEASFLRSSFHGSKNTMQAAKGGRQLNSPPQLSQV